MKKTGREQQKSLIAATICVFENILFKILGITELCYTFASPFRRNGIRTRSSMDRIMDSGSIDWGSTPHGCTHFIFFQNMRVQGEVIRDALFCMLGTSIV